MKSSRPRFDVIAIALCMALCTARPSEASPPDGAPLQSRAQPKAGRTFDPPLSTQVPASIAALPRFGRIVWTTRHLPWVEAGPDAGISGVGVVRLDGRIYVYGGFIPGGDETDDAVSGRTSRWMWRYEPETDSWERQPDAPMRREYVRAIAARDRVYVIGGGCQYKGQDPPYAVHGECAALDLSGAAPVWKAVPALNVPRTHMSVGRIGDFLVVAGGNQYDWSAKGYSHETIRGTVEVLDARAPEAGWQVRTPLPGEPRGWSASFATKAHLYAVGGITWNAEGHIQPTRETLRYAPGTDTWEHRAPPPVSMSGWEGALYADRYAILIGGVVRNAEAPDAALVWSDLALAYDTREDAWFQVDGSLPPGAVFNDSGVVVMGDRIYVVGGEGPGGSHFDYFLIGEIQHEATTGK